jgi:hypothetical protein
MLENVFVDLGAQVSSEWTEETVEKTRRQAFIFITRNPTRAPTPFKI